MKEMEHAMKIIYQGRETETSAQNVATFVDVQVKRRSEVVVELNGGILDADADWSRIPLVEGAELNIFQIVSGG